MRNALNFGFVWAFVVFSSVKANFTGFYRVLLALASAFIAFHKRKVLEMDSSGLTRFLLIDFLLSLTEFDQVLLDFTGFY